MGEYKPMYTQLSLKDNPEGVSHICEGSTQLSES